MWKANLDIDFTGKARLFLWRKRMDDRVEVIYNNEHHVFSEGEPTPDNGHLLREHIEDLDQMLQALTDAAWDRGIRPKALKHDKGYIEAQEKHLTDMRKMVGSMLGVDLV